MSDNRIRNYGLSHRHIPVGKHQLRVEYDGGKVKWLATIEKFRKFKREHPDAQIVPRTYNRPVKSGNS